MKQPLLSIIIPVYNASATIPKIVNSILGQSFSDFELILIDDGSSDNTLELLDDFAKKDSRIVVVSQKNGGPSSARNTGLKKSRGKYIQFFDADDDVLPEALKITTEAISQGNFDLVVSGWQIDLQTNRGLVKGYKTIKPADNLIDSDLPKFILESIGNDGALYNLWNKLFRADVIKKHNLKFNEDIRFGEDLIFALNYFQHISTIKIISEPTYSYQANSDSSVFSKSALVPEFRKINDEELVKFASNSLSDHSYDLLQWVRWRWILSFWMVLASSSLTREQKLKSISSFKPKNITVSNRSGKLGLKKNLLKRLAKFCLPRPSLALFIASGMNFMKSTVKFIKLSFRA